MRANSGRIIKTLILLMAIFVMLILATRSRAADWSTRDKTIFTIGTALNIVDMSQTNYVFNNPDKFKETNPVLSEETYLPVMVGLNLFIWWAADRYDEHRTAILLPFVILKGLVVANNVNQGCGISFSF